MEIQKFRLQANGPVSLIGRLQNVRYIGLSQYYDCDSYINNRDQYGKLVPTANKKIVQMKRLNYENRREFFICMYEVAN
jgi:hypothetical protein